MKVAEKMMQEDGIFFESDLLDIAGRHIEVGSSVVYGIRSGNSGSLRIGTVIGFKMGREHSWQELTPYIVCEFRGNSRRSTVRYPGKMAVIDPPLT